MIETQDLQIIERESVAIQSRRDRILALKATDEDSFVELAEALKEGKRYVRSVKEFMAPVKVATDRAHKAAVEQEKILLKPGEEIVNHAGSEVTAYQTKQERLRLEALATAERERQQREDEALLAATAETARLVREAEDAIVDAAATAEANGDLATAQRILAEQVIVPTPTPVVRFTPPVQMPEPTRVDGLSFRGTWDYELVSLTDVIREVSAGRAPMSLLKLDEVATRAYARSTRGTVKVNGLRFVQKTTAATRLG